MNFYSCFSCLLATPLPHMPFTYSHFRFRFILRVCWCRSADDKIARSCLYVIASHLLLRSDIEWPNIYHRTFQTGRHEPLRSSNFINKWSQTRINWLEFEKKIVKQKRIEQINKYFWKKKNWRYRRNCIKAASTCCDRVIYWFSLEIKQTITCWLISEKTREKNTQTQISTSEACKWTVNQTWAQQNFISPFLHRLEKRIRTHANATTGHIRTDTRRTASVHLGKW